jgi:hypothetical protein
VLRDPTCGSAPDERHSLQRWPQIDQLPARLLYEQPEPARLFFIFFFFFFISFFLY